MKAMKWKKWLFLQREFKVILLLKAGEVNILYKSCSCLNVIVK